MEARIAHFRRGKTTQRTNQMIIKVEGVTNREEASKLLKKTVEWKTPGKKGNVIKGVLKTLHGNSGAIRAHFEKGMPGQAIGTKIIIN